MSEKPPFDPVRAAFYLVAGVLALYAFVIISGVLVCVLYAEDILRNPSIECDPKSRFMDLLASALAAALALYAGQVNKKP